jgi:RNA polymerase primary sigma factor
MVFPTNFLDRLFSIMDEVDEHYCEHCPKHEGNICSHLAKTVADKNGWSIEEATRNIHYLVSWKSLDEMIENEEDIDDSGEFADNLFEKVTETDYGNILMELLETIKPREKEVLLYRNGFTEKGVLTLEEVGQILEVTRERVRQIEDKALRRMRHHTRIHRLKG